MYVSSDSYETALNSIVGVEVSVISPASPTAAAAGSTNADSSIATASTNARILFIISYLSSKIKSTHKMEQQRRYVVYVDLAVSIYICG